MIDTSVERVRLPLAEPFTIARGTRDEATNIVVRLDDGGATGIGAAAPSRRYGETPGTVDAVLPDLLEVVRSMDDPLALDRLTREMRARVRANPAARAAVSIAAHDLAAKRLGIPLYRLWGLDPSLAGRSSFTIGIDSTARMREKTRTAVDAGYGVLKVKVGTDRDREIVEAVREEAPDATIRVDANEAWTPREAVERITQLADADIEFVEQPVAAEDRSGLRFVHERAPVPIAADESCVRPSDVPPLADATSIVNVKLMKCGGPRRALELIHTAHAHGLEVMLGCMLESNASIAAGCHLAPAVDYVDLDGALLLASDPYDGVPMPGGRIDLEGLDRGGTGAHDGD